MVKVYNTMTGKKEEFAPLSGKDVKMYVCGVTVYDLCHIGHARSAVAFDVVRRGLEWFGYNVTFVKNYTDIDDKIINKANQTGRPWREITEEYIREHDADMASVGVLHPTHTPRATDFIKEMVKFCEDLIASGHAYESNGDVYYDVSSFHDYGKLSGRDTEDLLSGARVDINESKRNPLDFALWKSSKPGEPFWSSPWGNGRPGWHIECSVMSSDILGASIDIHGGGQDLIFPHHENEIAQSEARCGCNFAKYWMHNGFVNIDKEKMSKSLGNFFTIKDILKSVDGEVLRYFLLTTYYRQPLEYSDSKLVEAESALNRLYTYKDELKYANGSAKGGDLAAEAESAYSDFYEKYKAALEDDFNTPAALAALFDFVRAGNKVLMSKPNAASIEKLKEVSAKVFADVDAVLHIANRDSAEWYKMRLAIPEAEVNSMIANRNEARAAKDFAKADAIRDELASKGVEIIDTTDGTRYRTKR